MSKFTRKLLSVLLAAVMILGTTSPAAAMAAGDGDIFDFSGMTVEDGSSSDSEEGDIFENTPVSELAGPAETADAEALPKEPMRASVEVSSAEPEQDYGDNKDGAGALAFDGNPNFAWHTAYGKHAESDLPHWIQWNLGEAGQVFEVSRLHYDMKKQSDTGNGRWEEVTVILKRDGRETGRQSFTVTGGNEDLVLTDPVEADAMRVEITRAAGSYACAGELTVYGRQVAGPETPPQVAPGTLPEGQKYQLIPYTEIQNPTASSQHDNPAEAHNGDGPADWAFDNLTGSAWHCHYDQRLPQWIQWDLGGTRTVGQIGYVRNDNNDKNEGNGRWKDITVIGLLPGGGEKVLTTGRIAEEQMSADGTEVKIGFEPTEVTGLRVEITGSYNKGDDQFAQAGEIRTYEVVEEVVHHYRIEVTPKTLTMQEGRTATLTARAMDGDRELTEVTPQWQALESGVVTSPKASGQVTVTAVGAGNATVRVTAKMPDGATYNSNCKITVEEVAEDCVIALNGVDYRVHSLQEAVDQSGLVRPSPVVDGLMLSDIESLVFKSGVIRKADFDYIQNHKDCFRSSLKTFRIEEGVGLRGLAGDEIPQLAFYLNNGSAVGLEHVYLGSQIKGMGNNAFGSCENLLTFEGEGLTNIGGLGKVYKLTDLYLPGITRLMGGPSGFARGPLSLDRVARIVLPNVTVLSDSLFTKDFYPSEITLGATVPSLYPSAATGFRLPGGYPEILLHVPDEALEAYKASSFYDAETGTWAGLTLVEPEAPAETVDVTFTAQGMEDRILSVEKGQQLGTLPEAPAKDGFEFVGWFNGPEKITAETTVNSAFTATARYEEIALYGYKINTPKQTYQARSLQDAVEQSGESSVTMIHAIDRFTQADLDYLKTIPQIADTLQIFVLYNGAELPDFPDGTFPAHAFDLGGAEFTALETINLGNTVKKIGAGAFANCPNLDAFIASDLTALEGAEEPFLNNVHGLQQVTVKGKDFNLDKNSISGFAPGPDADDANAKLYIQSVNRIYADVLSPEFYPSAIYMGSVVPELYPEGSTTMNVIEGREIRLHVPDNALADYWASPLYDNVTDTWAGLKLMRTYYGAFDPDIEDSLPMLCPLEGGEKLPAEYLGRPHAPDPGYEFAGWFLENTHVKLTTDYVVTGDFSAKPLYVKTGSPSVTYHVDGKYDEVYYFEPGQRIGSNMPAEPAAPEGRIFMGWFRGDEQITDATEVTGSITANARFEAEVVADALTARINGTEYGGPGLEALVTASGVAAREITSLEMVSGEFTKADRDYMKTNLQYIETFTLNVSDTMQLLDNNGAPTTTLGSSCKLAFTAPADWNPGPMRTLTLGGITDVEIGGISGTVETLNLPDCINAAGLGLEHMTTLNLPKAKVLGNAALNGAENLTTLNLGAVETLGWHSFEYTPQLTRLTLPASLKKIEEIGFGTGAKKSGTVITFQGSTPPTVHAKAFENAGRQAIALVPAGALGNYVHVKFPAADVSGHLSKAEATFAGHLELREQGTYRVQFCLDEYHSHDRFAFVQAGTGLTEAQIPAVTVPQGQQLLGWNTKAGQNVATVEGAGYVPAADVTLYPVFGGETQQCTVTFTAEGMDPVTRQVPAGELLGELPQAPAKEGYTFVGWFDGDTEITSGLTVTGNINAEARYRINKYTVRFLNGTEEVARRIVEHGGKLGVLPANPAPDQEFKGWFAGGTEVKPGTLVTSDMTITASFGPERLFGRDVNFYVFVDGQRVAAAHRDDVVTRWIDGRQCIAAADLEAAYGAWGFRAENLADGLFLHTDRDQNGIWNAGIRTVDGVTYAATINHKEDTEAGARGNEIDLYYLPGTSGDVGNYNDIISDQTFYTVTNDQNEEVILVFTGTAIGEDRMPAEPQKEGFTFTGWQDAQGNSVTAETRILAPTELTAQWADQGVCRIQETGTVYPTIGEAMKAAEDGQTLVLLQDVREDMVILNRNLRLDLNGKKLTTDALAAFAGSHVLDSVNGTGRLIVTSGNLVLDQSNVQFPIYREDGYAFGNMVMQQTAARFVPDSDGDAFSIVLKPLFLGDKEGSHKEFGNGTADNRFVIGARLGWTRADGTEVSQNFIFSDELVAKTYGNGDALILNVSGVAGLEKLSIRSFVQSETGVKCTAVEGMDQ